MNAQNREILLIDDQQDKLESLAEQVRVKVDVGTVQTTVQTWCPREGENPSEAFDDLAGDNTVLVVTDYDLTTAIKGLFGHSVVAWCRNRLIPVGDFFAGSQGRAFRWSRICSSYGCRGAMQMPLPTSYACSKDSGESGTKSS